MQGVIVLRLGPGLITGYLVALGKLLNFPDIQFPYLCKRGNNSNYFIKVVVRMKWDKYIYESVLFLLTFWSHTSSVPTPSGSIILRPTLRIQEYRGSHLFCSQIFEVSGTLAVATACRAEVPAQWARMRTEPLSRPPADPVLPYDSPGSLSSASPRMTNPAQWNCRRQRTFMF